MAEPIEILFGVGLMKHVLGGGCAHWSYLANTTEPSMCGSDVAFCQINLTTDTLSSFN